MLLMLFVSATTVAGCSDENNDPQTEFPIRPTL